MEFAVVVDRPWFRSQGTSYRIYSAVEQMFPTISVPLWQSSFHQCAIIIKDHKLCDRPVQPTQLSLHRRSPTVSYQFKCNDDIRARKLIVCIICWSYALLTEVHYEIATRSDYIPFESIILKWEIFFFSASHNRMTLKMWSMNATIKSLSSVRFIISWNLKIDVSLGASAASELDVVFSGYQPR